MKIDLRPSGYDWSCPKCLCENHTKKPSVILDLGMPEDVAQMERLFSPEEVAKIRREHLNDFRVYCRPRYLFCCVCDTVFNIGDEVPNVADTEATIPAEQESTGTGTE